MESQMEKREGPTEVNKTNSGLYGQLVPTFTCMFENEIWTKKHKSKLLTLEPRYVRVKI